MEVDEVELMMPAMEGRSFGVNGEGAGGVADAVVADGVAVVVVVVFDNVADVFFRLSFPILFPSFEGS